MRPMSAHLLARGVGAVALAAGFSLQSGTVFAEAAATPPAGSTAQPSQPAMGQDASASAHRPGPRQAGDILQEVVVTAQKRTQRLQDVPISVTALTAEVLQAERISNVLDLTSATPNMIVHPAPGGASLPVFSIRGLSSYGAAPGSDKEVSIYIDGVYLGATTGSAFELADIDRIEVLHGPQGTLFGRNATGGAISIVTPEPPATFGLRQEVSTGNYGAARVKTRVNTGSFGSWSVTLTYVHDERQGDVRNTGAGTVWSYPEPGIGEPSSQVSPKHLGDKDVNAYFSAIRYQPNPRFKVVYRFDYTANHFTPDADAIVGLNPQALGPAAAFLEAVLATQPRPLVLDPAVQRPNAVDNSFTTPGYQRDYGHNLTATYQINGELSIKSVLSYRDTFIYSNDQLDGAGGLTVTQSTAKIVPTLSALQGSAFELLAYSELSRSNQWSDETQFNYEARYLSMTLGAIYFHQNSEFGGAPGLANNYEFSAIPGNVAPPAQSTSYNRASSTAGYVQAEAHLLPEVDLVGGYRTTTDDKSGSFFGGGPPISFTYNKAKPSYLLGLNYHPAQSLLIFAKYSTAFVSGGAVGPVVFAPETANSYEGGVKAIGLGHRLQGDLEIFDVQYNRLQFDDIGLNIGYPQLGTVVVDLGGEKARGFEFQGTAAPGAGLTFSLGAGYTDFHYTSVNPVLGTLSTFLPALEPKWTVNPSAQYLSAPLIGSARLLLRMDANWRSRERLDPNSSPSLADAFPSLADTPPAWEVSARFALQQIHLPVGVGQIVLWVKNITQDRSPAFASDFLFAAEASFVQARTFGLDLICDL